VIDPAVILAAHAELAARCDVLVIEGAGGWRVPLAAGLDMQDLALMLGRPVLLVVGLRLGCLNHALLSAQAIRASGAYLAGWIGSQVDPRMARLEANVDALRERLGIPCLGVMPHAGPGGAGAVPLALDGLLDPALRPAAISDRFPG
jgi:dethiobiotin synthetase